MNHILTFAMFKKNDNLLNKEKNQIIDYFSLFDGLEMNLFDTFDTS